MPGMNKAYRPTGGTVPTKKVQKPQDMARLKQIRDTVSKPNSKMLSMEQSYKEAVGQSRGDKIRQTITKRPGNTTPSVNNMSKRRTNRVMWANKLGYNPNKKMGNGYSTLMGYQLPTWKQIKANPGYTGPKGPGKRSARAKAIKKNIKDSVRFL